MIIPLLFVRPPVTTLFPYTTLFRSPGRCSRPASRRRRRTPPSPCIGSRTWRRRGIPLKRAGCARSRLEEHTSELQSRRDVVCRLLLEKNTLADVRLEAIYDNPTAFR